MSEAQIEEAVRALRASVPEVPHLGVVLGSGLSAFADSLTEPRVIPMDSVPHLPGPSVPGHAKNLCFGRIGKARLACFSGRVHAYEGHPLDRVVFGVRLLAALGCRAVLLTNAAGGIRDDLGPGSFMLISDQLNLTGQSPLVGPADDRGPRFPDMTEAYDAGLRTLGRDAAEALNLDLREGVYAGLLGPSYETPAEVRMLRTLGADAVGMSTVLEVIALRQRGVRVAGVSTITNRAAGLSASPLDHSEVQATAERVRRVFVEFLTRWATLASLELARE
jgi:purine-nucleoside phosphorylase